MPKLQQFRYLVAIAETLHFRRAAEKVHVTQPTLSSQLRELEDRLGVQLVERSRARVALTPIGKEVASRAKKVLNEVQEIVDLAKHGQDFLGGTVRLGVPPSLGPYLLPHLIPDLHSLYPRLRLYIREGVPQTILAQLEEARLDLLFFPLPIKGAELRSVPLFREPLWVVVSQDHRLAQQSNVERADLAGETVLALEPGHRLHNQVREICEEHDGKISLEYEGTSLDTLRQMIGMGMGISLLPALYVRSEVLHDSQVVARTFRARAPYRSIGLVWRRETAREEEFLALGNLVRRVLSTRTPEVRVAS